MNLLSQVDLRATYYNDHQAAMFSTWRLGTFISKLLPNVIMAAGVVTFAYLVISGFNLINIAGKNANPQEISKTRVAFTHAIIGFLLVALSYFILQLISTVTGVNFIFPNFN